MVVITHRFDSRGPHAAAMLLWLAAMPALAVDLSVSGRMALGAVWRTEAPDPRLLTALNAAALGRTGSGSGSNADDANLNYQRGDMVSRAVRGALELQLRTGEVSGLLRVKGWLDDALLHDDRPWGNAPNGYASGQPLSDRGTGPLGRFRQLAVDEAWVQASGAAGALGYRWRLGQQLLPWGERPGSAGGLEALNARDFPSLHRAGANAADSRRPAPMLFARADAGAWSVEAYRQGRFTPAVPDQCGTLWSMSDYLADGCDMVMSGPPAVSDRARVAQGAYMARVPLPLPDAAEYGAALIWRPQPGSELGLYHARYNARMPMPVIRRATRAGPPLVPGDPGGGNMAYGAEYAGGLALTALSAAHQIGRTGLYGELVYRPRMPFMLSPLDVVGPLLNPAAPALLRSRIDAVAPGGLLRGYDLRPLAQLTLGLQSEAADGRWRASAEVVAKHAPGLPDPATVRYNRSEMFGGGPVLGQCPAGGADPGRQCTQAGYATPDAFAYRLRLDLQLVRGPSLRCQASAIFLHDVKGWSGDFLINQGRKQATLALRAEWQQHYVAELAWMPLWGGAYNAAADRDTLALAVGYRF